MTLEEIRNHCLQKKGVEECFPFGPEVLVFKIGGKIFLLCSLDWYPAFFNAKADPDWSLELREQFPQITPGYHMSKKHWNSVQTEGLKPDLIKKIIDHSYDLVLKSLPKKLQQEINS